ncbi:MAG: hypothetical protein LBP26_04695 [Clostridiales bacterium]|jgi:hypothetical protein|nr:hypothetical protein [Clostridiales bacterium]
METVIHIRAAFKCVYLLNGAFVENADAVRYDDREPIYITALPLSAHHLPYTVKALGGAALSNPELASIYTLPERHYYVKLAPRYNYVYSPEHRETAPARTLTESFFFNVKGLRPKLAREALTPSLSQSIDDAALKSFFDGYVDIIENTLTGNPPNGWFLIDKLNKGSLFVFEMKDGLIDNIVQV